MKLPSSGRVRCFFLCALALSATLRAQLVFSPNYSGTATSGSQQTATTAALNSLAGYFTNSLTLKVSVTFSDLGNSGTLGESSASFSAINGVYYATPLYNALANADTSGNNTSITITMNTNASITWDYSASTPAANNAYSWQSVIMHEVLHSMGFYDGVADSNGSLSNNGYTIFDTFSYFGTGASTAGGGGTQFSSLTTDSDRASAIISNNMYWKGTNALAANGGNPVKLYAPTTFASGSTYSHIDPSQTSAGGLLFPALSNNTYFSGPTAVELAMMKDMGWSVSAIPEPATVAFWLAGAAFGVVIFYRRRGIAA